MSSSPRVSIDADADAIGDDVARLPIDASVVVPSDASSSSARRERERERERDDEDEHRDDGRARLLAVPIASSSAFVGVPLCEDEDDDGRPRRSRRTVNDALDRVGFGKFQWPRRRSSVWRERRRDGDDVIILYRTVDAV